MKKQILKLIPVICIALAVVSCKKDKAAEAETTEAEQAATSQKTSVKFKTDSTALITWKGFKPTGSHEGTIAIESGVVNATDGTIDSGTFLIDMNSIVVTDIPAEEEGNASLTGHLKSADFFDAEKFPTAAFTVTGMETKDGKTMLSGNLKLKDKQNNITFPVTVSQSEDALTLESETFTIDRSKWDVQYGSKSFFDNLGDKFINDDIELKISLKATKA